jgi:hypothetical protein
MIQLRWFNRFFNGCLPFLLLLISLADGHGQPARLTGNYVFPKGIYTSFSELVHNAPRYAGCELDVVRPPAGYPKYYYYDSLHVRHKYHDSCFAVVNNGTLFVRDVDFFFKCDYPGAISVLVSTNWHSVYQKDYVTDERYITLLDFESGAIVPFYGDSLAELLRRDPELFAEYSSIKKGVSREVRLSYIIKYNARNPFYVK